MLSLLAHKWHDASLFYPVCWIKPSASFRAQNRARTTITHWTPPKGLLMFVIQERTRCVPPFYNLGLDVMQQSDWDCRGTKCDLLISWVDCGTSIDGFWVKKFTGLSETLRISTGLAISMFMYISRRDITHITGKSSILGTCVIPNCTQTTISSSTTLSSRAAQILMPSDPRPWNFVSIFAQT